MKKKGKGVRNTNQLFQSSHGVDVQSPGGHSNSDDVDGNDYSEQVGSRAFVLVTECVGQYDNSILWVRLVRGGGEETVSCPSTGLMCLVRFLCN